MWNGTHTETYNLDGPNYNKRLIYNLLCRFVTQVVRAWITVTSVSYTHLTLPTIYSV